MVAEPKGALGLSRVCGASQAESPSSLHPPVSRSTGELGLAGGGSGRRKPVLLARMSCQHFRDCPHRLPWSYGGGRQIQSVTEGRVGGTLHSQSGGRHISIPLGITKTHPCGVFFFPPLVVFDTFDVGYIQVKGRKKLPQHFLTTFPLTRVASPSLCTLDGPTWPPRTFLLHDAKLNRSTLRGKTFL